MAPVSTRLDPEIEDAITEVAALLRGTYRVSHRTLAILLLLGDEGVGAMVHRAEAAHHSAIERTVAATRQRLGRDIDVRIQRSRLDAARELAGKSLSSNTVTGRSVAERLGQWCARPWTGIPILALVVSVGLYWFVGVFGGGTLVELLEVQLFEQRVNPLVVRWTERYIPWEPIVKLLVGDYGIWTLGITYAFALILPLVGTFFLAFSILEDSGYLPRLALLVDRGFKRLGLSGRAVIPIVLGFGCDTMATIVTRILETKRERMIATFLLSLAIPCSAQLGVMTGLFAGKPTAFSIWLGIMGITFLMVGWLAAQIVPGEAAGFVLELPPMRWPTLGNVLAKTVSRMQWYFMEVVPLFILASVLLWFAEIVGALKYAVAATYPIARMLGLPEQAGEAFLFGFFRRDYGAAGLYRMQEDHLLTGNQELIAVVTLTLFLPCIAQLLVMRRERGTKAALAILGFIFPFALAVGTLLNWTLRWLGIQL